MAIFKFAPNLAVSADVKYIDIVPSDKGGPQVRLKGSFDGETGLAYLPGKLTDTLTVLIGAGVIANKEYPMEVEEPFEIKPLKRQFQMMKAQAAGEKYGSFKVLGSGNGNSAAAPSGAIPPSANAGAASGGTPKSYADIYMKATDFILEKILPKYKAAGLTPTASDAKEMVATLFIPKSKE